MARVHKKHHKIPSTYLEGFVNSKGVIWIGDEKLKIYPSKPKSILSEGDYYTIRFPSGGGTLVVETKFLNGIESTYAKLYREKISQKKELSKEDKAKLAIFVASMMERQPGKRESLEKFFKDVEELANHMRGLSDETKKRMASMPKSNSSKAIPVDDILRAGKDVGSLHSSLIPGTVKFLAPIIFDMKWVFMLRPSNSVPFITSDNPCILANPAAEAKFGPGTFGAAPGFIQKDIELSLPLSSDIALFCGRKLEMDCIYMPVDSKLVEDINRRTKRSARIILCSDKSVIEKMAKRVRLYKKSKRTGSKKL